MKGYDFGHLPERFPTKKIIRPTFTSRIYTLSSNFSLKLPKIMDSVAFAVGTTSINSTGSTPFLWDFPGTFQGMRFSFFYTYLHNFQKNVKLSEQQGCVFHIAVDFAM